MHNVLVTVLRNCSIHIFVGFSTPLITLLPHSINFFVSHFFFSIQKFPANSVAGDGDILHAAVFWHPNGRIPRHEFGIDQK